MLKFQVTLVGILTLWAVALAAITLNAAPSSSTTSSSVSFGRQLLATPPKECKTSFQCPLDLSCTPDHICGDCTNDKQCAEVDPKNVCKDNEDGQGRCVHKGLFHPFDQSDLAIALITFITIALSAPAGTGGGGILVPMYIVVGQFDPHSAIPLSKATIFGGAIANNLLNLRRRHPTADRPLVDFNTAALLEPVLLLGTVLGVFTNAVSPGWLITCMLVVVLSYVSYRTFQKGFAARDAENNMSGSKTPSQQAADEERAGLLSGDKREVGMSSGQSELQQLLRDEARPIWWSQVGILLAAWVVIFICSYLKGGEGAQGVVSCGTAPYWLVVFLPLPVIAALTLYTTKRVNAEAANKERINYPYAEGDLRWGGDNTMKYVGSSFFAGFTAGALGIAAGTVLGPVLLELGLLPIVATGTSGFMVLFTASSTTAQFLIMGQLKLDYAAFFALIGVVGAGVGNTAINWLFKKLGKTYFIIFVLATIIGCSVVLMGILGLMREADAVENGRSVGFRSLCNPE